MSRHDRSTAARHVASLMGVVRHVPISRPDKGDESYYRWTPPNPYQAWRDAKMAKLRAMRVHPEGEAKHSAVVTLEQLRNRPGTHVRLVDGHGKAVGKRLVTPLQDLPDTTRVRIVKAQPEDMASFATRMRNRAHRLGLAE